MANEINSNANSPKLQIVDDGYSGKYFHQMLNMDDDDLDPFQYRLLGHYRRVCGARSGSCTESVRTTAQRTQMSVGMVVKAREELTGMGYIEVEKRLNPATFVVHLLDRMPENIARFSNRSYSEQSFSPQTVHGVNGTVHGVNQRITRTKEHKKEQTIPALATPPVADDPSPLNVFFDDSSDPIIPPTAVSFAGFDEEHTSDAPPTKRKRTKKAIVLPTGLSQRIAEVYGGKGHLDEAELKLLELQVQRYQDSNVYKRFVDEHLRSLDFRPKKVNLIVQIVGWDERLWPEYMDKYGRAPEVQDDSEFIDPYGTFLP